MLIGGFFAPNQSVPDFFRIFEYISVFKYEYQAFIYAQFFNKRDGWTVNLGGQDFAFKGDILAEGNRLYFEVIIFVIVGTFLAEHVFDGHYWFGY